MKKFQIMTIPIAMIKVAFFASDSAVAGDK
jgi:hypothetical protein